VTGRKPLDAMTSDDLDQLHARLDKLESDLRDSDAENLELARHNDETCEAVQRRDTAEAALERVRALTDRWVKAGPPLGTPMARWWGARLVEIHAALDEPAAPPICELPHQTITEEDACEQQRLAAPAEPKDHP